MNPYDQRIQEINRETESIKRETESIKRKTRRLDSLCLVMAIGVAVFVAMFAWKVADLKKQPTVIHYRIEIVFPG